MFKYILPLGIFFIISGCTSTSKDMSDGDNDGIPTYKDICKATPKGAQVNKYGCALDKDFDGVIDLYDKCPNTTASELVNQYGCTIKRLK